MLLRLGVLLAFAAMLCGMPGGSTDSRAGGNEKATSLVPPPWGHCYGLNRVNQTHLDVYSGYRKKFRSPRGIAAVKLAYNDSPSRNDDDELTVYGVNAGSGEIIYNTSLLSIAFFGSIGSGSGQFLDPTGVAATREGLVVVADTGNDRIVILDNVANDLRYRASVTLAGTDRPFRAPRGVAIEHDSIYVADSGNGRIVVMNASGEFIHELLGSAPLFDPYGIAVISDTDWNHYGSRFMILTDSLNQRILRLSLDGNVERTVRVSSLTDRGGGCFFPAIDYYSNVYATDTITGCVYKFDKSLQFLTSIGCSPDWDIHLHQPRGIAIYRRFGQIFIAEQSGATYFWIGTDVLNLECRAEENASTVLLHTRFLLTEHSLVTIALETERGKEVEVFAQKRFMEPGRIERVFMIDKGRVPCDNAKCMYSLVVTARPTYASKKYLTVEKKAPVRNL
jgi:hypothetical protein